MKATGKEEKTRLSVQVKDIKSIAAFVATLPTQVFRGFEKEYSPGPVTFILNANNHLAKFLNPPRENRRENTIPCRGRRATQIQPWCYHFYFHSTAPDLDVHETADYILENYKHKIDVLIHSQVEAPVNPPS